jgi:hypothetical protein
MNGENMRRRRNARTASCDFRAIAGPSRFSHLTLIGGGDDNSFNLAPCLPDRLCATGISRLLELRPDVGPLKFRMLTQPTMLIRKSVGTLEIDEHLRAFLA